jgi:hypothetical protein
MYTPVYERQISQSTLVGQAGVTLGRSRVTTCSLRGRPPRTNLYMQRAQSRNDLRRDTILLRYSSDRRIAAVTV